MPERRRSFTERVVTRGRLSGLGRWLSRGALPGSICMRIAVQSGDGSLSPRYCAFQDVRRDVSGGGVRDLAATLPSDVDGAGHNPRSRTVGTGNGSGEGCAGWVRRIKGLSRITQDSNSDRVWD